MPDIPPPTAAHRQLHRLAGTWVGDEEVAPSPWDAHGGRARGRIEARVVLDGFFLVSDYVEERGGHVVYRGHGIYGWDPQQECYTMHWFDSRGARALARGRWRGDRLQFESLPGTGFARYVYEFDGEDRYVFRVQHSRNGTAWSTLLTGRYARA